MEIFETKVRKMEMQLKQWGAKLDELGVKAGEATAEAKIDYRRSLDNLKSRHQATQAKLEELRFACGGRWEAFTTSFERAWRELEATFKQLAN